MSIPAETARQHLTYTKWASRRLVEAAAQLTEEERTRDFRHADKSVLGTLVHVFAADRIWLARITGNPVARFIDPEADMKLSVLENDWPALHEKWLQWAATLDDSTMHAPARYNDLQGNEHTTPLWQIVLHVVNHATHHRGQVSAMMRAMGHKPPPLDLIAYYRTRG
jgi:uncharacterized damage-inducible protein DinB